MLLATSYGVVNAEGPETSNEPRGDQIDGNDWNVRQIDEGRSIFDFKVDLDDIAGSDANARGQESSYERFGVQGYFDDEICHIAGTTSVPPALAETISAEDLVWVQREIELDQKACRAVVEGAWLSKPAAESAGYAISDDPDASLATASETDSDKTADQQNAAGWSWDGRIKGFVEDPPQIDVTSATSRMQWSGSTCSSLSYWRGSYWGWLWGSGWTDVERWKSNVFASCARGRYTHGKYKNGVFCATNDTWTNIDVTFRAKPGGASNADWDVSRWGGCSWLLNGQHYYDPN